VVIVGAALAAGISLGDLSLDGRAGYLVVPNPRAVFELDGFHVSHSLAKVIRKRSLRSQWIARFDMSCRSAQRRRPAAEHMDQP